MDWSRLNPAISVVLILLLMGSGLAAGAYIAALIYLPFYNGSEPELMNALADAQNHPELERVLYGIHAGATLGGLFIAPLVFLKVCRRSISNFFAEQRLEVVPAIVVCVMVIILMVVNSIVIDWNSNLEFPSFLKEFEHWAREQEHAAVLQTEMLTRFDSVTELSVTGPPGNCCASGYWRGDRISRTHSKRIISGNEEHSFIYLDCCCLIQRASHAVFRFCAPPFNGCVVRIFILLVRQPVVCNARSFNIQRSDININLFFSGAFV
jgi:hypothetical protein